MNQAVRAGTIEFREDSVSTLATGQMLVQMKHVAVAGSDLPGKDRCTSTPPCGPGATSSLGCRADGRAG